MLAISEIKKRPEGIDFDQTLNIKDDLMARNPEILDVKDVTAIGNVSYDDGLYLLTYTLDYTITLPSSRSMEPVDVHLNELISEVFVEADQVQVKADLIEDNLALVLEADAIDLNESAVDNILLSIPMRVLTEEEAASDDMPSGNSWSVLTEEQFEELQNEKKQENNPFAALNGLFDE